MSAKLKESLKKIISEHARIADQALRAAAYIFIC